LRASHGEAYARSIETLVHDCKTRPFARSIRYGRVREYEPPDIEDPEQDQHEDRKDQRELNEPLTATAFSAVHHLTSIVLEQGTSEPGVMDWKLIVKLPFGAPGAFVNGPVNDAADQIPGAEFRFTPVKLGTLQFGAPTTMNAVFFAVADPAAFVTVSVTSLEPAVVYVKLGFC
jgi:hypothetical protein